MSAHVVSLGEITETVMGQAPPGTTCNKDGEGTIFVKAGEFSEIEPIVREWTTAPLKFAKRGDVLVCVVGATAGKINLGIDCAIGRSVAAVRPDPKRLDTGYLHHFLRTRTDHLRGASQGLAQGVITREMISKIEIPLCSLDEQRRIAAILDNASALTSKRKRAIGLLANLTQSIFLDIFGDPEANPKAWKRGRVADLLEGTQYGTSDKAGEKGRYPILRMGNITDRGRMDFDDLKYIDLNERDVEKFTVRRGDILFNRTNSAELVGKTAVYERDERFAFAGYLVRARPKSGVSPHYISGYLNSSHGKATLRGMAKSIVGMANINAKEMAAIPILLPDPGAQKLYEEAVLSIERNRSALEQHMTSLNVLLSSLQSRAFSGDL